MIKRLPAAYWIPLLVLATIAFLILQEAFWGIVVDWFTDHLATELGQPRAKMIGSISTWLILALVAGAAIYAAYLIGVHERRTNPSKLEILFSPYVSGCRAETRIQWPGKVAGAVFFRIWVRPPKGQIRKAVSAKLVDVMALADATTLYSFWSAERLTLTWATHTSPPVTSIDLHNDHGEFLDVFCVTEDSQVLFATPGLGQPASLLTAGFVAGCTYYLFISISVSDFPAQEVKLRLIWPNDWKNVDVEIA